MSGTHTSAVERLDLETLEWDNPCDMLKKRSSFVAIESNKSIFALGGFTRGKDTPSNSIDRMNTNTMIWYRLNVTIPVKLHTLCFCRAAKGSIVVLGSVGNSG